MEAAQYGNLEMVKLLISKGAKADLRNPYLCTTAFHNAAYSGNINLIDYMLTLNIQRSAADRHGNTALAVALANRRDAVATRLKSLGIPQFDEPFEFCSDKPPSPTASKGDDVPSKIRELVRLWQTQRNYFLDARILASIITDEELGGGPAVVEGC